MKFLLSVALLSVTVSAFAKLPAQCEQSVRETAALYLKDIDLINKATDITPEEKPYLIKMNDDMIESTLLFCEGMKMIELERSFSNKIGLVSEKSAQKKAAEVRNEAKALFDSLLK